MVEFNETDTALIADITGVFTAGAVALIVGAFLIGFAVKKMLHIMMR